MKTILWLRCTVFLLIVQAISLQIEAQEDTSAQRVLIINTVNPNYAWGESVFWHTHDVLKKKGIQIRSESLSVPAIQSLEEVEEIQEKLRQQYEWIPDAVVFIGYPGWMICRDLFDDVWKEVPTVVVNSSERLPASLEVLLSHQPITKKNSIPVSEWLKGYNITSLRQDYHLKENIGLMLHLMPEMKRLAFISDNRYASDMVRQKIEATVRQSFPQLTIDQLVATHISSEELLDTLKSYDRHTGILYYSWFEHPGKDNHCFLFDRVQDLICDYTNTPVFTLSGTDLSTNTFAGGCYSPTLSFSNSLVELLERILAGEQARHIPETSGGVASVNLCYPVLQAHHIPASCYPADAVYTNRPPTFLRQYQVELIAVSLVLLLLCAAIVWYIRIQKRTNVQLVRAKKEAEESNQLKSVFLANMSHEIRTPLNSIVGFANMLPMVEDKAEMKEYVGIIENNTELLLQLINDILDMSKIEAGMFDFAPSWVDVNQLMRNIEQSTRLRIKDKAINIVFEEKLPQCRLYTDSNRLMQVVTNFVNNAIKFTDKGEIRIGYCLQGKDTFYAYVSDTGCGMSPEQCRHVFERFVKYNTFAQGSGLGLSICRVIVEKQGGKIGVKSQQGAGSVFWFTLPYRRED